MEILKELAWKVRTLEDELLLDLIAKHSINKLFLDWSAFHEFNPETRFPIRDTARVLKQYGFKADSFHSISGEGVDLGETDSRLRKRALEIHKLAIETAGELDACSVVFHLAGAFSREARSAACSSIESLLPLARERGVVLALENMKAPYYGSKTEEITFLISEFDHPNLRICFDAGHANISGGIFEALGEFEDKIAAVHLHDNFGKKDRHLPLGLGNIPWGKVLSRVERSGCKRHLACESRPSNDMGWEDAIRLTLKALDEAVCPVFSGSAEEKKQAMPRDN